MKKLSTDDLLTETDQLLEWIQRGGATTRFITQREVRQDYTLFVNQFIESAHQKGFVVSRYSVPEKNSFYKVEDLYAQLTAQLDPPDFLHKWVTRATREEKTNLIQNFSVMNLEFGYALYNFIELFDSDEKAVEGCWNYICGRRVSAPVKRSLNLVGGVKKENVENYFICLNRLIQACGKAGWVIVVENVENIANARTETMRNEAYNNLRQFLDLQASNKLKKSFFLFFAQDPNFVFASIHEYKALAERIYPESDLNSTYVDLRSVIWVL